MPKQTTGEFLSLLRKAAGYTQEDIADKLNISNKTISSWETDRTMPDVLLLPAIADLYGVTVDEILRGERTQPDKPVNTELTEKSKQAVRKNKYGKFSVKCFLLTGLCCLFGALVFAASFLEMLYYENWISILLYVIGFSGVFVCITVAIFFAYSIKVSEGVVYKEDLTPDTKAIIWLLSKKIRNLILITAIPFGLGTAFYILGAILGTLFPQILVTGIPFACLLISGFIWHWVTRVKYLTK